jgi:branched-chain amino acid transport system ATP-binding protein
MTPLLSIRGLSKHFGAVVVADGIDLDVFPNTIHAIIGPNGAGKTSLAQQLSGTLRPDAGTITLAGTDITHLPIHRRARLGLIRGFQIVSVIADFTATENVALVTTPQTAAAMLARVGLTAHAATRAKNLSHGDRKKLELAMVLAASPKLLLLDEPLAGAGPEETAPLIALLRTIRADCAILLIEHDMDAVFALADTISVLEQGRIIAAGPPAAIRANPTVRAAYLGDDGEC